MECRIDQLSIFEQHKVALARSLVNRPAVLIVENIDAAFGGDELSRFAGLLRGANTEFGVTPIVTAMDGASMPDADCVVRMVNGSVAEVSNASANKGGAGA